MWPFLKGHKCPVFSSLYPNHGFSSVPQACWRERRDVGGKSCKCYAEIAVLVAEERGWKRKRKRRKTKGSEGGRKRRGKVERKREENEENGSRKRKERRKEGKKMGRKD